MREKPTLTKLDATRDLHGIFYVPEAFKARHKELAQALEREFGCAFRDNGNSYLSCFQFEGRRHWSQLPIRIKVYCKTLALLQSETVSKSLVMNTNGLFVPNIRMGRALSESRNEGQSRIEITYSATSATGEDELLRPAFHELAQ